MANPYILGILAHNEEHRIRACLDSLVAVDEAERTPLSIYLVVNGSSDRTAEIARSHPLHGDCLSVHELNVPDKCNAWNHFIHGICPLNAAAVVLMDGDTEVHPGSIRELVQTLAREPRLNAASALPLNGRSVDQARQAMLDEHGLCGDLYALQGEFVARIKQRGIRLPVGQVGDDSLIGALAATDLGVLANWDKSRIRPCPEAGFYCEPVSLLDIGHLRLQFRRMIRYSVRRFEMKMVQQVLSDAGPETLPPTAKELHRQYRNVCRLEWRGYVTLFDWLALRRIDAGLRN